VSAHRTPPRSRPAGASPIHLTAQVEEIATSGVPARQHASTPEPDHPAAQTVREEPAWVNFSTYLPAPVRRALKARCAALDVEVRQAVAEAITSWLDTHPAED
jgi:hypothetical protein